MFTTVYRLTVSTIHDFGGVTYQDLPSDPVSCRREEECGSVPDIGYLVSIMMVAGLTFIAHSRKWDLRYQGSRLQPVHPFCSGYRSTFSL